MKKNEEVTKAMKKIMMILVLLIACISLTGCGENAYIKEITLDEFNQKLENKETFILEVMSTTCSACKDFAPKLEEVTNKYKVTVYQLNTHNMSDEDYTSFSERYIVKSTPTLLFFNDGQELTVATRIVGSVSKDKVINQFKNLGFIE